jgi:hypothetical protein
MNFLRYRALPDDPQSYTGGSIQYRARLGLWLIRWNTAPLRTRETLHDCAFRGWPWLFWSYQPGNLWLGVGRLQIECWHLRKKTADEILREAHEREAADVRLWSQQHGLELCGSCQRASLPECLMSPTCAENRQQMLNRSTHL